MKKSKKIDQLAKALNQFQAEISGAKKKEENPYFHSKYANLEEVIRCAKEPLMNSGLSVSQFPISGERTAGVETILMHESGQWISCECLLACAKVDPQGMGSAISYARRYSYQSILGIPSEDDDANEASKEPSPAQIKADDTALKKHTAEWVMAISQAADMPALQGFYTDCKNSKYGLNKAILAAKDARKEQLGNSTKEPAESDSVMAQNEAEIVESFVDELSKAMNGHALKTTWEDPLCPRGNEDVEAAYEARKAQLEISNEGDK